tara:strand:- start:943 stop:1806 length:864 start_codon:yes stop_codon:yes gene_type:complete
MSEILAGKSYTLHLEDVTEMLAWVDATSMRDEEHVLLISRLPQRRLVDHVHLEKVEAYWLTSREEKGTILPDLEEIRKLLSGKVESGNGIAVIEGIEWLLSLYDFDEVINFVMAMNDTINSTNWSLIYTLDTAILTIKELARLHKESVQWSIPKSVDIKIIEEQILTAEKEIIEEQLPDDTTSNLAFLIKIPRTGYTKEILRKRVLQWRRMGLDVSEVEPALFSESLDDSFKLYQQVENKVRKATELDNRLDILEEMGHRSEVTKMRFRVRQLTGFDEVEKRIEDLI